jgi:hypothetical protein
MPSLHCFENDESGSGHHSSCEIVTFVFLFWGALRGKKQLDGAGVRTIHTQSRKQQETECTLNFTVFK